MTTEKIEPRPVQLYRENLPPGKILDFPYGALDRLDVPIHTATLSPDGYDATFDGLSYGTTQDEAKIGAFGELAETAFAKTGVPKLPRTRASYNDLVSRHGESGVLDPIEACLEAGSTYDHDRVLDWVEARRYPSGETVLVPVDLVASTPGDLNPEEQAEERLVLPVTNGLGAGPSLAHALSHGILEMVQRDGNSVNYRAVDQGVVMDLDEVSDPEVRALLEGLDRDGIEVIPKLAADDYGITNVYVVGHDRNPEDAAHPIMLSACGEAAHPDREKALRKALLEFIAARARKLFQHGPLEIVEPVAPAGYLDRFRGRPIEGQEERALEAMVYWLSLSHAEMMDLLRDPVFSERSRVAFSGLPLTRFEDDEGREKLLEYVVDRMHEAGMEVLYVDLSPESTDVKVVHAIVPGLEGETVSYGRIGARNLKRLLDRGGDLVSVGEAPERGRRIILPERHEETFGPAWIDDDALDRAVGRLYPLYREPDRHLAAQVAKSRGLI